jgi:hypothetical protein
MREIGITFRYKRPTTLRADCTFRSRKWTGFAPLARIRLAVPSSLSAIPCQNSMFARIPALQVCPSGHSNSFDSPALPAAKCLLRPFKG